jgi:hypothetical protein
MKTNKLLTKREILILLKCHKHNTLLEVAKTENVSISRIRQIRDNALRKIRFAARITPNTNSHKIDFNSIDVMANMADKADIDYNYLVKTLSEWIFEGINDCTNNLYWNQVSHTKPHPTPKELLDFLHQIYIEKIDYYWDFKK